MRVLKKNRSREGNEKRVENHAKLRRIRKCKGSKEGREEIWTEGEDFI